MSSPNTLSPIRSAAQAAGGGQGSSLVAGDRAKIIVQPLIDKCEKKKDQSAFGRLIAKITGKSSNKDKEPSSILMTNKENRSPSRREAAKTHAASKRPKPLDTSAATLNAAPPTGAVTTAAIKVLRPRGGAPPQLLASTPKARKGGELLVLQSPSVPRSPLAVLRPSTASSSLGVQSPSVPRSPMIVASGSYRGPLTLQSPSVPRSPIVRHQRARSTSAAVDFSVMQSPSVPRSPITNSTTTTITAITTSSSMPSPRVGAGLMVQSPSAALKLRGSSWAPSSSFTFAPVVTIPATIMDDSCIVAHADVDENGSPIQPLGAPSRYSELANEVVKFSIEGAMDGEAEAAAIANTDPDNHVATTTHDDDESPLPPL